jgi:hypothetical protein
MTREDNLVAIIDTMRARHAEELRDKDKKIAVLKEQVKKGEYVLKGVCGERLSIRVEVSPQVLASTSDMRTVRAISERAAEQLGVIVEKRLGDRYELVEGYNMARKYIYYLQNHATRCGVQFTPFNERESSNDHDLQANVGNRCSS